MRQKVFIPLSLTFPVDVESMGAATRPRSAGQRAPQPVLLDTSIREYIYCTYGEVSGISAQNRSILVGVRTHVEGLY